MQVQVCQLTIGPSRLPGFPDSRGRALKVRRASRALLDASDKIERVRRYRFLKRPLPILAARLAPATLATRVMLPLRVIFARHQT